MTQRFDIVIAGSGPVGCCLALALAELGLDVALAGDRRRKDNNRALAIAAGPWHFLQHLCPDKELERHAAPVRRIEVRSGASMLDFSSERDLEHNSLCHIIEQSELEQIFSARLEGKVTRLTGRIEHWHNKEMEIICQLQPAHGTDATDIAASLLVGCDGPASAVRHNAGIEFCRYRASGASTITCSIKPEQAAPELARQIFLPDGPLALLPMTGDRLGLIFTANQQMLAKALHELDDVDFVTELRSRSDDFTGPFKVMTPRRIFPIASGIASRFYSKRLALAGDCAHLIHPMAGQGLNMGLQDAAILSKIIAKYQNCGLDIGSALALAEYDRCRRPEILSMLAATESLAILFGSAPLRGIAGLGIGAFGKISPLRKMVARTASSPPC